MDRRPLLAILIAASAATGASADPGSAFPVQALPDPALAAIQGRLLLPNGIELAMTVQSDTVVDGHLLLRTVFAANQGPPTLAVLAPAGGSEGPAVSVTEPSAGDTANPRDAGVAVVTDRAGGIAMVRPTYANVAPVTVSAGRGVPADNSSAGLVPVNVSVGGPSVVTGGGAVSANALPNGTRIALDGDMLAVSHLVGQAFGTVVANMANDRRIDTMTTIDLDLRNANPNLIGSTMFQVEALSLEATRGLVR